MKKKTFLLSVLLCCSLLMNGQVLISKILDDQLLLGPQNVTVDIKISADHWTVAIENFQSEIKEIATQNLRSIQSLEQQKKQRRKDQRKLFRLQEEQTRIEEELNLAEELLLQWMLWETEEQPSAPIAEACLELISLEDTNAALEIPSTQDRFAWEIIPTEYIQPKREWVKKQADRNCQSSDPNDCMVWCLVEVKGGFRFVDLEGVAHQSETCPTGFTYQKDRQLCQRKWRLVDCPAYISKE